MRQTIHPHRRSATQAAAGLSLRRHILGLLALLASTLAAAQGVAWAPRDAGGILTVAGRSADAAPLFTCRAILGPGTTAPGRFWTSGDHAGQCRIAVAGREQSAPDFEMLVQAASPQVSVRWIPGHAMSYPRHALVGGHGAGGRRWLVCAAWNGADDSMQPGSITDGNCIYARDGGEATAETYLVLVTNDPALDTTAEAQPAAEGFDPGAILALRGVAGFCVLAEGSCARTPPADS